jgi:hypothetical protein
MGHIDELESVDSLVDLLNFIRDENMHTGLLLQPKVQAIVKNSFKLLGRYKTDNIGPEEMSETKLSNIKRQLQSESELHSKSQSRPQSTLQLNLQFAHHKPSIDQELKAQVARICMSPQQKQVD